MYQDDLGSGLHGVEIESDPLDYHSCDDPQCQANLDAYFLHRIETYTPMLQMMRSRRKEKRGSDHDSAPVVVVTNWQHAEHYPPEWVLKLQQVCVCVCCVCVCVCVCMCVCVCVRTYLSKQCSAAPFLLYRL